MNEGFHFVRVMGVPPAQCPVSAETFFPMRLLGETFGPPEKFGQVYYWNFSDGKTKKRFTLSAEETEHGADLEVSFISPLGDAPIFYGWASDRLAQVENGDLRPAFAADENLAVAAVRF